MYAVAAKVWCPEDENEPEGLFNKGACPEVPSHWFKEEPSKAAELYAMERFGEAKKRPVSKDGFERLVWEFMHKEERLIHVLDNEGKLHKFKVKTKYEVTSHVQPIES